MKKIICVLLCVMLLGVAFAFAANAAAPEVKINDTISYQKEKQLSHTNTGSFPVYESTYKYLVIESVTSLNECAKVSKISSGWVVTFVKAGNAKILIKYHNRETYSKYNTEEQKVYSSYDKNSASQSRYEDYKVLSLADSYKVPDGYAAVYKDGHEYIDFAKQDVINAKFGESTLVQYANLQDFFGFSYKFEDNCFYVTLDNFTGNGLFFRCPKKDTNIMITLKGKNTLNGVHMAFNKEAPFSAIAATGSKSVIWITASEKNAELNINMEAVKNKNDSDAVTRIVPFFANGGTQVECIYENTPPTVNVKLTTAADALGNRAVNLATADLSVIDSNFNYTYETNGYLKNYNGVTGRLFLNGETIFTGTLNNRQYTNNITEYLFPKITYANKFKGGAYFECTGGKLIKESKNEVFIPNTLCRYETTADQVQYRAVTSTDDSVLTKVDPSYIAAAFPTVHVGKTLPKHFEGLGFNAGIYWTDSSSHTADYTEKNETYNARVTFVPTKGYYLYLRNLSASELSQVKPASVYAVYNVPLQNTTTTCYDVLDFRLHKIQSGSPTITQQPKSALADPGETVYFNVTAINTNPSPDGYEWHSVTYVKFLGVTIPWDTKLSDNSVYSGTKTSSLKVNVNSNLYKVRYYYCKVNGTGWDSVYSSHVTITQPKRITRISLGGEQEPLPGYTPDRSYAYGFDHDNIYYSDYYGEDVAPALDTNNYTSATNSPAAKLDYSSGSSETDGCFWYRGKSSFAQAPDKMSNTDTFKVGETYTYRFRVLAKSGYKFADNVEFTSNDRSERLTANAFRVSDTEYLVDFTYEKITYSIPSPGENLIFRDVPVVSEDDVFTDSATVQEGVGYTLTAQKGWLESPESTSTAVPKLNGTYYVHYTLVAKEGYSFSENTSGYYSVCYNADDGKSLTLVDQKYVISDSSNTSLEVYLAFKCTQRRVKDLTLKGLPVPSVGDKLVTAASVDPATVTVTAVKYYDMTFSELPATYVTKPSDVLTVSVFVKAKDGVSFTPDAEMVWTVVGNKLSAKAQKDAGMSNSERRFDFNVSAHEHEWTNAENVAFLKETATCTHGTIYYKSCVFCEAQGTGTFETDDKMPHATTKVAAKAASCTANGNIEYYQCSLCGKLFKDSESKTEIKSSDTVVKAKGHQWDAGKETTKATYTSTGVKTFTCKACGATKTETIPKLTYIPGDVDGDGSVLAGDARYALRAAVGLDDTKDGLDFSKNTNRCFLAADITGDKNILAEDARLILRAAVGLCDLNDPGTW